MIKTNRQTQRTFCCNSKMKVKSALTICFLLSTAICYSQALEVLAPEDLIGTFNAPRLRWVGPSDWTFGITGTLVRFNHSNDVANKIVLVDLYHFSDLVDLVNRQALGVLAWADNSPGEIPGLSNFIVDESLPDTKLPVVAISLGTLRTFRSWLDEGRNITVRVTSDDVDQWSLMMESGAMIFYSVFMSAFTLTCIGLAVYKLIMFVQAKGCQESIPQTMLIMEIVANTLRFFPSAVDPLQSRALLPYAVSQMFFTTSWPFVIINLLLISFYWHELITKTSMKINSFLHKLRIPFWCIFAVILAAELTASILRGLRFSLQVFLIVMAISYIVISVPCIIFYIITGVKLTRALGVMSDKVINSGRARRLNSTSRHIYASAAGVVVWIIVVVLGGLTDLFWLPWGFYGLWFAAYGSITFISLMQILALHEPKPSCMKVSRSSKSELPRTTTSVQLISSPRINLEDQ